jgi:hypothetical protein
MSAFIVVVSSSSSLQNTPGTRSQTHLPSRRTSASSGKSPELTDGSIAYSG